MVVTYFHPRGWLIQFSLFSPNHFPWQHKNGENPPNYLFFRTFRAGRMYFLSFIAAESQHHEESRLIHGPFESTLLDQGFPVEHELDACNPPVTGTLLCCLKLLLCLQRYVILLRHPATSFLGNLSRRTSCLSPTATKTTHLWVKHHSCPLTANTIFAMSIAMHIPLRHSV